MAAFVSITPDHVPPPFDQDRARRFAEEFAPLAPSLLDDERVGVLIRSAAANSPFLARSMLKEHGFVRELFERGPDAALDVVERDAEAVAAVEDAGEAMRLLRTAKRRAALAIALADLA